MCWAGAVWQISVRCPQFCCEPKSALKNSLNIKIKDIHTHTYIYMYQEAPNEIHYDTFRNTK